MGYVETSGLWLTCTSRMFFVDGWDLYWHNSRVPAAGCDPCATAFSTSCVTVEYGSYGRLFSSWYFR